MQKTNFKSALSIMMLAVLSAFMSISFQSCGKDDDGGGDADATSFVGKWTVADPSDNGYDSFEFTDDQKYIITQRTTTPPARSASVRASETVYIVIIFGDISLLKASGNEYTLNLKNFGTIKINIDSKGAATVTVDGGETYTTKKEEEVKVSDKTELLCHTWKYKIPEDRKDWIEATVTFTKSGTYLNYEKGYWGSWDENGNYDPNGIFKDYAYGIWEWTNTEQTEMRFKNNIENEYEFLKMLELTDKYMKIEGMMNGEVEVAELYRD